MMTDEFNFLWSEIQNYIAEAAADSINSVHTRRIVKTSGFTGVFVKIGDFIKFKRF